MSISCSANIFLYFGVNDNSSRTLRTSYVLVKKRINLNCDNKFTSSKSRLCWVGVMVLDVRELDELIRELDLDLTESDLLNRLSSLNVDWPGQ